MAGSDIPRLQNVLVTTDLSEPGDQAIAYAYALPRRGGRVHVLHVIDPVSVPNPMYAHYQPGRKPTPAQRSAQRDALRERLERQVPASAGRARIQTLVHVLESNDVVRTICAQAADLEVDAVCIASHGHGLAHVVLGSTAEQVIERCGLPVLVVRFDGR